MIVILGLVILIAAVVAGVVGVVVNTGADHALNGNFTAFGYHFTGSTGTLFLYGIVVGAVGMAGLSLLLAGSRRNARRARAARRELDATRRDAPIYYGPAAGADAPHSASQPVSATQPAAPKRGLGRIFGRGRTVHQT